MGVVATKKATVTLALEEFIARRELAGLPALLREASWDPAYDHKADRRTR